MGKAKQDPLQGTGKRTMRPEDLVVNTKDGKPYDVPEEGSLALLALGYKGLMAWRAKRIQAARDRATAKSPGP